MATFFSDKELLEFAIGIERNGAAFYQKLSTETDSNSAKDILNYLSKEEEKHEHTFRNMVASTGKFQPAESYPGEYRQYLQSLIDNTIFTDPDDARHKAESISDEVDALDIGIRAEKDSILFYTEMQKYMSQPHQKIVQDILTEEKSHLRQIADLKNIMKEDRKWQ